jgi:hypothetical protein
VLHQLQELVKSLAAKMYDTVDGVAWKDDHVPHLEEDWPRHKLGFRMILIEECSVRTITDFERVFYTSLPSVSVPSADDDRKKEMKESERLETDVTEERQTYVASRAPALFISNSDF